MLLLRDLSVAQLGLSHLVLLCQLVHNPAYSTTTHLRDLGIRSPQPQLEGFLEVSRLSDVSIEVCLYFRSPRHSCYNSVPLILHMLEDRHPKACLTSCFPCFSVAKNWTTSSCTRVLDDWRLQKLRDQEAFSSLWHSGTRSNGSISWPLDSLAGAEKSFTR